MNEKHIEALKLALEALKQAKDAVADWGCYASEYFQKKHDLQGDLDMIQSHITAIREALAEQPAHMNTKQTEALKLALGELQAGKVGNAMQILREALAENSSVTEQPAQQEPVAVVSGYYGGQCVILPTNPAMLFNSGTAFYTFPPASKPWVGLTDEEVDECYYWKGRQWTTDELVRHVEAKLREKNGNNT